MNSTILDLIMALKSANNRISKKRLIVFFEIHGKSWNYCCIDLIKWHGKIDDYSASFGHSRHIVSSSSLQ